MNTKTKNEFLPKSMHGDVQETPGTGCTQPKERGLEFHMHYLHTVVVVFQAQEKISLWNLYVL